MRVVPAFFPGRTIRQRRERQDDKGYLGSRPSNNIAIDRFGVVEDG
jgi:hypothetical protein